MAYKIYNKAKLLSGLQALTGKDFADAEFQARQEGDKNLDVMTSRTFYAALASKVFKVPLPDILALPIKEYATITGDVGSFLLEPSASETETKAPRK